MALTVGGLVSGLDTNSIIDQLLQVERQPIVRLQQREAGIQVQLTSYGSLEGSLKALQSSVKDMLETIDFDTFAATSTNTDLFDVSADSTATAAAYTITAKQLAQQHKVRSQAFANNTDPVGGGTIHLKVGSGTTFDITVTTTDNIDNVAKSINDANAGVNAAVIFDGTNYFLNLTADNSGTGNVIDLTVTDDDGNNTDTNGLSRFAYTEDPSIINGNKTFLAADLVGAGTLKVNVGGVNNDVTVTGTDTLSDVATKVSAIVGVTAVAVDDGAGNFSLRVSADDGTSTVALTAVDGDGSNTNETGLSRLTFYDRGGTLNLSKTQDAKDAKVIVDGLEVVRSSNILNDVIPGLNITLKDAAPSQGTQTDADYATTLQGFESTITVSRDTAAIVAKADAFISAYNDVVTFFNTNQAFDNATKIAGPLFADSTTNLIRRRLSDLIADAVPGVDASVDTLVDLGLTEKVVLEGGDQNEVGTLELDTATLTTALNDNYDEVVKFFTQTTAASEGFSVRFDTSLDGFLDFVDGTLIARQDGLQRTVDNISKQITAKEDRLTLKETRLIHQFASLESLLGQFVATEQFLTQQITAFQNLRKA